MGPVVSPDEKREPSDRPAGPAIGVPSPGQAQPLCDMPLTAGWHDSADPSRRFAAGLLHRGGRASFHVGPVLRLIAVAIVLVGTASLVIVGQRSSRTSPVPVSSLHFSSLLAEQNASRLAKARQARQAALPIAVEASTTGSEAPRQQLPIVRARVDRTPAPAAADDRRRELKGREQLVVRTERGPLQMRNKPDDDAVVVGSYPERTPVTVIETLADWQRVIAPDGRWGWIRASGVTTEESTAAKSSAATRVEVPTDRLPAYDGQR